MVHILAPQPRLAALPIFFNVDGAVGANAPNANADDVMLVQFLLRLIGDNPSGAASPVTPTLKKVNPTGKMDQDTIAGITAIQTLAGLTPDGRVSVAKHYQYGTKFYTIVDLNFSIRSRAKFNPTWPNLDKIAGCPGALATAARAALAGVGAVK